MLLIEKYITFAENLMEITKEQLLEKINTGEKMIVDFYSTTCGPCKMLKPIFENLSNQLKSQNSPVSLYTFNIENDINYVVSQLGIRGVPTLKSYTNSEEKETIVGMPSLAKLNELVANLN